MASGLHHFKDKTLIITAASTGTRLALGLAREGGLADLSAPGLQRLQNSG